MESNLKIYKFSFIVISILISQTVYANHEANLLNASFQIDFRSMHVWRGTATSLSPTLEPSLEISKDKYKTGIWFAQSLDGNYTELDLYLTYEYRNFSFAIYDYYCPSSIESYNEITNYQRNTTKHTIEFDLVYSGSEKIPIKLLIATMIYGDDLSSTTNNNYYSTYLQLAYSANIDHSSIDLFVGLNPFQSYYGEKVGIVNAGITASRNLYLYKSIAIPFQASVITNPLENTLFLIFGFML